MAIRIALPLSFLSILLGSCGSFRDQTKGTSSTLAVQHSGTSHLSLVSIAYEREAGGSSDILACGYELDRSLPASTIVEPLSRHAYRSERSRFLENFEEIAGATISADGTFLGLLTMAGVTPTIPHFPLTAYGVTSGLQMIAISSVSGSPLIADANQKKLRTSFNELALVELMTGERLFGVSSYHSYKQAIILSGNTDFSCLPIELQVLKSSLTQDPIAEVEHNQDSQL